MNKIAQGLALVSALGVSGSEVTDGLHHRYFVDQGDCIVNSSTGGTKLEIVASDGACESRISDSNGSAFILSIVGAVRGQAVAANLEMPSGDSSTGRIMVAPEGLGTTVRIEEKGPLRVNVPLSGVTTSSTESDYYVP